MRADDLVAVMESFVGIAENPPGSNRTPIGEEYGWNGVSWCAEAVSVACHRLGFPLHEAAVVRIANHAKAGDYGLSWTRTPVRGAIACYDWGRRGNPNDMHTGVVRDVLANGRFRAIEGNYRDRCEVVLRDMTYVMGFAVPPFDDAAPTPLPQPTPQPQPAPTQEDSDRIMNLPVLRRGSTGFYVQMMQALMLVHARDLAKDVSFVDGDFGPHTEDVLRTWQGRTQVLEADGVCGPNTWRWITGTR